MSYGTGRPDVSENTNDYCNDDDNDDDGVAAETALMIHRPYKLRVVGSGFDRFYRAGCQASVRVCLPRRRLWNVRSMNGLATNAI